VTVTPDSSTPDSTGTGRETGTTTEAATADAGPQYVLVPLTALSNGYVSPSIPEQEGGLLPNTVGVTGSWYAYGDSWGTEGVGGAVGVAGERGNCQLIGGFPTSDCSSITSPLPPAPIVADAGPDAAIPTGYADGFPSSGSQTFCLSGTAAAVIDNDAGPDYSDIYGIGLGLDLNNPGGTLEGGAPVPKLVYNATGNGVIGVQFTLSWSTPDGGVPLAGALRVEFPTGETAADGGTLDSYDIEPAAPGVYTVLWSQLEGAPAVIAAAGGPGNISYTPTVDGGLSAQPPFDPTKIFSIQFHVSTSVMAAIPVDNLCVSNLSAVTLPTDAGSSTDAGSPTDTGSSADAGSE
jgi:hypothetical protein